MIEPDRDAFGIASMDRRMLRGGLPPFFLAAAPVSADYGEWVDSYFAKDVLEHFRPERRGAFLKLVELVFARSGGLFETSAFAAPCEISRNTAAACLDATAATHVAYIVRPFSSRRTTEIVDPRPPPPSRPLRTQRETTRASIARARRASSRSRISAVDGA